MRSSREISNALNALGAVSELNAQLFDELVQEAALDTNDCSIQVLLKSFDDQCPYDELMFSVVHAIESRERSSYLNCLLSTLAETRNRAPKWSRILHTRIMNSPVVFESYLNLLPGSRESSRVALRSIFTEIYLKPKFSERAKVGLDAIESANQSTNKQ